MRRQSISPPTVRSQPMGPLSLLRTGRPRSDTSATAPRADDLTAHPADTIGSHAHRDPATGSKETKP